MGMDLPQVLTQVQELSHTIAQRAEKQRAVLPHLEDIFEQAGKLQQTELLSIVARAGERWAGARPTLEPIADVYPSPDRPFVGTVIGADGSQIYPDRHDLAYFAVVNIGSLSIGHGSGETPVTQTRTQIYTENSPPFDDPDLALSSQTVDAMRDVMELGALADGCNQNASGETLAILDNGLLLWIALQVSGASRRSADVFLQSYLQHMTDIQSTGAALAGFIDRPRTAGLLALLHLTQDPTHSETAMAALPEPFAGFTDRDLLSERLPVGHRSARFIHGSPLNQDFRSKGHEIQYFYLNTGGTIARVEIPTWVGEQTDLLGLVHAGLLAQCEASDGYPYALIRAHELAVPRPLERQLLEDALAQALLRRGLSPRRSRKAQSKLWTGGARRHRV